MPWPISQAGRGEAAAAGSATVVARLRPGVSYAQAQAEIDTVMSTLAAAHPHTSRGLGARLVEMGRLDEEYSGPALSIVLATVALVMLAVRAESSPEELTRAVGAEIAAVDPSQPVYHVKTLDRLVGDSLLPRSTAAALMTLFSTLALLLAAVGIYGVITYGVSQQTREFGLRIALGATRGDLLRLVLRNGLVMVGAGIGIGAIGALAGARVLSGALYGVTPSDPLTYAGVVVLLGLTGLAACIVPAWRASRVLPVAALRAE